MKRELCYKIIKNEIKNEIIIKKSKFITYIKRIKSFQDIHFILSSLYDSKATHHCYGSILNGKEYSSDDGEPIGTAGKSILTGIKLFNLNNILVVILRYYGGIKLGKSGLGRAYYNSTVECLKMIELEPYVEEIKINIQLEVLLGNYIYDLIRKFEGKILEEKYEENSKISFQIILPKIHSKDFIDIIQNQTKGNCLINIVHDEID